MARLPSPALPPGPLDELIRELHALHAKAGWPSTREMARDQPYSHTTVSDLFSRTSRVPRRQILLGVVGTLAERMDASTVGAQTARFDALWEAAELSGDPDPGPPEGAPRPTALCIALGSGLRRLRESAGVSRESAAAAIRVSTAKLGRLELGRATVDEAAVAGLLTHFGVADEAQRARILQLAQRANEPGWWYRYADLLPSWFETYLGLEQVASVIRTYELQFVPGLLQTREYAHAVTALAAVRPDEIKRRVELRMRRQDVLTSADAPVLWAVVEEAALRRSFGGPELTRAQLTHLLEVNERPNVSLQIVPLAFGGHPAVSGAFTLLRFAHPELPDVVYLEQLTSALYLEKPADVETYSVVINRLAAQIEPPSRTADILSRIRSEV